MVFTIIFQHLLYQLWRQQIKRGKDNKAVCCQVSPDIILPPVAIIQVKPQIRAFVGIPTLAQLLCFVKHGSEFRRLNFEIFAGRVHMFPAIE